MRVSNFISSFRFLSISLRRNRYPWISFVIAHLYLCQLSCRTLVFAEMTKLKWIVLVTRALFPSLSHFYVRVLSPFCSYENITRTTDAWAWISQSTYRGYILHFIKKNWKELATLSKEFNETRGQRFPINMWHVLSSWLLEEMLEFEFFSFEVWGFSRLAPVIPTKASGFLQFLFLPETIDLLDPLMHWKCFLDELLSPYSSAFD